EDGFTGLTIQQIDFFNHIDLSLREIANIYENQMNLTVDKVDKKAQGILATVDKMVYNCSKALLSPQMQQMAYEAKAIFNSLPFVDNRPKLTAFFPTFVAPSSREFGILIKCVGNFPALPRSKVKPILHFNGTEYPSIRNQPDIAFSIPLHDLFPLGGSSVHGIRSASFDVTIPYQDSWFWNTFWPSQPFYHYQGSVYLLPESPGKITIHYTRMREDVERDTIKSDEFKQNSRGIHRGGEGKTMTKPHTLQAKPGWKIVPESVQFHVIDSRGEREHLDTFKNKWEKHLVTPEQATYLVTTHYYGADGGKHAGKIRFKISADIVRTHPVTETIKKEYALKWGETMAIDESKGSWVIHFDSFDGFHHEVPGYGGCRFLRVQSFGGKPVIVMDAPEQVTSNYLLSNEQAGG
ncbi:MAG TPA: hypothetical protein VMR37_05550, partial [Rhabdochlamydiaceae bacterium]|nr:hypothetical protein [Rhabdochlamydiaceae bacterium]